MRLATVLSVALIGIYAWAGCGSEDQQPSDEGASTTGKTESPGVSPGDGSPGRAPIAREEGAPSTPADQARLPKPPKLSGPGADLLEGRKAVRTPGGDIAYVPVKPSRTSADASPSCTSQYGEVLPPTPGVRAERLDGNRLAVEIFFAALPRECLPEGIRVTIDVNDDGLPSATAVFPRRGKRQTLRVQIPERLRAADVVRASSETRSGRSSEPASVLIVGTPD